MFGYNNILWLAFIFLICLACIGYRQYIVNYKKVTSRNISDYIVWDGILEAPYLHTNNLKEYICLYDGPVALFDDNTINNYPDCICTIFYACKRGHMTLGSSSNGGLFTSSLISLMHANSNITFREAVHIMNDSRSFLDVNQRCEVMCRRDVLDLPVMRAQVSDAANIVMFIDACRTPLPELFGKHSHVDSLSNNNKSTIYDNAASSHLRPGSVFFISHSGHGATEE